MQYKNIYSNHLLKIRIFTNSKPILRLVDNFLDFTGINLSKPKIKIDFYLDEVNSKNRNDGENFLYQDWPGKSNNLLSSLGKRIVTVVADPKRGQVKATILNYQESYKERLFDSIFTQPLHFILARYGLFFLHASVVSKGKDCILITGPQDSGKSTLALTLAQNGFKLVADDDCFVKLIRRQTQLFPFPTKMGLNDKILERYQELKKHTLKSFRYGGKRRLSLNSISNSNSAKSYSCKMIIFPKYKADRIISINRLSKQEAMNRLAKENPIIYSKRSFEKMFWTLYDLTRQADFFEFTYNDNNLNKIAGAIKKAGNFKD